MRHVSRLMASGGSALVLALALSAAAPHRADARGAYNSADTSGVMVDIGALDDLGGGRNLPDLLLGRSAPAVSAPPAPTNRGMLLQPDPARGIHSRMLVTPTLTPPKGYVPPPVAPQPMLSELPELVPEPPATTQAAAPAPASSTAASSTPASSTAAASAPTALRAAVAPPPPAPAPEPAPVAEAVEPTPAPVAEPPQQVASAPATDPAPAAPVRPAAPTVEGSPLATLPFGNNQTELSPDARAALDAALGKLGSSSVIQVLAYASGDRDNPSKARRASLSRALAVRTYLIDKGVASNRIDVRALGDQTKGGSMDRVDIFAGS